YDEPGLPQLEHSLQRFPNLIFIAHGPVFWTEIAPLVTPAERKPPFFPTGGQTPWPRPTGPIEREGVVPTLFRRYGNLYGELSDAAYVLVRDPDYGARLLTEFQDRLLFGTDMCGPSTPLRAREMLLEWREEGRITEEVFRKIARENAIKLFGLE
ncbi:MAG: amidohydrolase family protein, partial [Gemmatimonadetes bacterium]|nr:amidohydrolase family protein [Gemmatimonadota bacterium]